MNSCSLRNVPGDAAIRVRACTPTPAPPCVPLPRVRAGASIVLRGAATPRATAATQQPPSLPPREMAKKAKKAPEEEAPKKGKKSAAKK